MHYVSVVLDLGTYSENGADTKIKARKLLNTNPKAITDQFDKTPKMQREQFVKKFEGSQLLVSGQIITLDVGDTHRGYVTVGIIDSDLVHIDCNFDKPVEKKLYLLNEEEKIKVLGEIFNISENYLVLDKCIIK